jgi:hypothetical protein
MNVSGFLGLEKTQTSDNHSFERAETRGGEESCAMDLLLDQDSAKWMIGRHSLENLYCNVTSTSALPALASNNSVKEDMIHSL